MRGTFYPDRSPVGEALHFDGYSSEISTAPLPALDDPQNLAISCWVLLDAYPWNRVPIVDQFDEHGRFFFGVDPEGHLLARIRTDSSIYKSTTPLPLRSWVLVTLNIDRGRASFTLNGGPMPATTDTAVEPIQTAKSLNTILIGHAADPQLPAPENLIHPDFPFEYALDGALSELVIYDRPLSRAAVMQLFSRAGRDALRPRPWPRFPRWEGLQGNFGAYYTSLPFDPVWDRARRIAPDSDVVVRFEDAPIQLIFWQGNNYVPAWVTENNRWFTDEFMEIYGHPRCPYGEDCEPMSDKQERYSHVRILESTPARAVVHWRYALSEVEQYTIADAPSSIAWGDWADEYWTVYPDGVAVRRSVLWSTAPQRDKTEFQDSIVLIPPGETPEDNIHLDALTFANLRAETKSYSWQPKNAPGLSLPNGPKDFNEPPGAVIQSVNLKSRWKPFEVAWGDPVSFTGYNSEKSISSFEWWNHWPVAQIPSSGRPALAADRAGHTSVSHIYWPVYKEDERTVTKILMDGLSTLNPDELVPLAASWRNPPKLELSDGRDVPYDPAQRAYVLFSGLTSPVRMTLQADKEHPAYHLVLILPGWSGSISTRVFPASETPLANCAGVVDTLSGSSLIAYIPLVASDRTEMEIEKR